MPTPQPGLASLPFFDRTGRTGRTGLSRRESGFWNFWGDETPLGQPLGQLDQLCFAKGSFQLGSKSMRQPKVGAREILAFNKEL